MEIGIVSVGSHEEKHGPALPLDTDARIAEHIGRETAARTNAEFLGTLHSSHEFLDIDTGNHHPIEEVVQELREMTIKSKDFGFEAILIVNAHGGNQKLENHLDNLEEELEVKLEMDSHICDIEGPHAGTGEISIGAVIGITDEAKIGEQNEIEKHPEIGFIGFENVREKHDWAEEHAQEIMDNGIEIDEELGKELIESAVSSAVKKIRKFETGTSS